MVEKSEKIRNIKIIPLESLKKQFFEENYVILDALGEGNFGKILKV